MSGLDRVAVKACNADYEIVKVLSMLGNVPATSAFGTGCVKTFFSAAVTQNQTGNRASTQNPHLLMC